MTNFDMVEEFHVKFDCLRNSKPTMISKDIMELRIALIEEELDELREGIANEDLVEIADALTDLLYVIYGTGHSYGLPLDQCFAEVHRSNMTKLGEDGKPMRRSDGKILKGVNYTPPNLKSIVDNGVPF